MDAGQEQAKYEKQDDTGITGIGGKKTELPIR